MEQGHISNVCAFSWGSFEYYLHEWGILRWRHDGEQMKVLSLSLLM